MPNTIKRTTKYLLATFRNEKYFCEKDDNGSWQGLNLETGDRVCFLAATLRSEAVTIEKQLGEEIVFTPTRYMDIICYDDCMTLDDILYKEDKKRHNVVMVQDKSTQELSATAPRLYSLYIDGAEIAWGTVSEIKTSLNALFHYLKHKQEYIPINIPFSNKINVI